MRCQLFASVLFVTLSGLNILGDEVKPAKPASPVFGTQAPENVDDLRALEKQVQAVVAKVRPATVGISIGPAQGSGVIIKGRYVLTAGHVSGKPGRNATIHLADGRKLKGKTLGHNAGIDSGLIKIEDEGTWPSVEMGKSADLKKGQWVVCVGHPGGFRPNRTPVVRLGRVQSATPNVINTDCTLVGGDSGGPLFDLDGKVIGIHSRIGTLISQNFHVPVDTYAATWERLASGESWGSLGPGQLVQSPGGKVVFDKKDRLNPQDAKDTIQKSSHHKVYTIKMSPGALYTLDLASKRLDSFLRLEDSSGKELAKDDNSAGELDARIIFRPSREDSYRVIATTMRPGQTGPYTLRVRRIELKDLLVEGKVNVLTALRVPRFVAPVLFQQLGRRRGLFVSGTVLDVAGNPAANTEVQFLWDGGKSALKTSADGTVRLRLSRSNIKDLVLNLPQQQRALLELTDASGALRFFNYAGLAGQNKAPTPDGMIVFETAGQITSADPMDKVKTSCRHKVHTFKVSAAAKSVYTVDLESSDFDAYLRVEGSMGKQLAEDDDSAGEFNARVVLRPDQDDNLRIIVTTCDPGQSGAYRLVIRQASRK